MTDVFDFRSYKTRKEIKQISQRNRIYEIYLTTIEYVHKHRSPDYTPPGDYLSTSADLHAVFNGESCRFARAFSELVEYWNIEINPVEDYPLGSEFEHFPTVGHLCEFIERRLRRS
ncbi:hypothetical protein [Halobacillus sp. Marseille-Q1614]|uniref:hypothetical protein n=1 Tax=Halobacillus sp. Marseille-Q1614 TaxID=2709134 RepID=UPI00157159A2|nr:hypothetical protein [Halobacillus sp. Marseille-Q1614]